MEWWKVTFSYKNKAGRIYKDCEYFEYDWDRWSPLHLLEWLTQQYDDVVWKSVRYFYVKTISRDDAS